MYLSVELNKHVHTDDSTIELYCNIHFPKRFYCNQSTTSSDTWIGYYQYSFGNIVYDKKNDVIAVVMNETKRFITLWYFQNNDSTTCVKKRLKDDTQFTIMKRLNW